MRIPYVQQTQKSIQFTQTFKGYNHNLKRLAFSNNGEYEDEGYFYDMENMTLDDYPVLRTRDGRLMFPLEPTEQGHNYVSAFAVDDNLLIANGSQLLYGDLGGEMDIISNDIDNSRKQFASIGAKILIMPDGLVFNSFDRTLTAAAKRVDSSYARNLTITPCVYGDDGNYSTVEYVCQDEAPEDKTVYWYDTKNKELKKYSNVSYGWVGIGTAYLMVKAHAQDTDLKLLFQEIKAFDTLSFTTLTGRDAAQNAELDKIARNSGEEGKGDNVIYAAGEDYVVIAGFITDQITVVNYTIERRMPQLDYITSLNNRIWGCSSEKHEIYACKLGDPTQWYNYPGIASDSYAATIGSFGDFTGATSLNSYALFFKENSMFKVYGDYPSNFQVVEIVCDGVEKGSERSIQEVGGALYYKGVNGMMMYDGSIPVPFADIFGGVNYMNAVAGAIRNKYYISMLAIGQGDSMFVLDTTNGSWVREDAFEAVSFTKYRNQLLAIDGNEQMWLMPEPGLTEDEIFEGDTPIEINWMFDTGILGLSMPNQKYISRIHLRLDLLGSIRISVAYDNGQFMQVFQRETHELRSYTVPIRVRRCDHYRLRVEGTGHVVLYSYGYSIEAGSDKQC